MSISMFDILFATSMLPPKSMSTKQMALNTFIQLEKNLPYVQNPGLLPNYIAYQNSIKNANYLKDYSKKIFPIYAYLRDVYGMSPSAAGKITSIAAHESLWGRSKQHRLRNNFFSIYDNKYMRYHNGAFVPVSKGKPIEILKVYNHPIDSINDYILWAFKRNISLNNNINALIKAMKDSGYFADKLENYQRSTSLIYRNHSKKWEKAYEEMKKNINKIRNR